MSAHTPGPWRRVRQTKGGRSDIARADGFGVAFDVPNVADADLIAAAPDLYEAAARLVEHFSDSLPDHLVEEFRDAIAKAGK